MSSPQWIFDFEIVPFFGSFGTLEWRSLWGSWWVGIDSIVFVSSRALKCMSNCPLKVPRKKFTWRSRISGSRQMTIPDFGIETNEDPGFRDRHFFFEKLYAHENPSDPSWSVFHELSNARIYLLWNPLLKKLQPTESWTQIPLWKIHFDDQNSAQNHKKWVLKYGRNESF